MKEILERALIGAGIRLSPEQLNKFCVYHDMLTNANRDMNLTRVEAREAVDRNYVDSLTPLAVPGLLDSVSTLVDVGSGAGFPGVPIAIARPDIKITLIDAQEKRVGFLRSVAEALELNVDVVHARCEHAARLPEHRDAYDAAIARAVAPAGVLCEWLLPFVKPGGVMLALKGPGAQEELARALPAIRALSGEYRALLPANVPGRDWEHKILVINKLAPTPDRFPRKAGMAEKRPLT